MKIKPVYTEHHDICNFVVDAESESDVILLRLFCAQQGKDRRLFMHSYGGNLGLGIQSFCFGWRLESDFHKDKTP